MLSFKRSLDSNRGSATLPIFSEVIMRHDDSKDDLSKPNLLPYGIVPQAPAITVPDVALFKKSRSMGVVHHFNTRVNEIKRTYEKFLEEVRVNDMIYSARYNFVPIVGRVYHLYKVSEGDYMLSLIEPAKWNKYEFVGSYKMASNDVWELVEEPFV